MESILAAIGAYKEDHPEKIITDNDIEQLILDNIKELIEDIKKEV